MNEQAIFDRYVPPIEAALRDVLQTPHPLFDPFYGMMRYHLGFADESLREHPSSGGKYVRPVLTLLSCEAAGGDVKSALPAAVAVELVHDFSLVHDDLEDRSDLRRHRKTVWRLWGDAQAINAGDGLFALSRLQIGRLRDQGVVQGRVLEAMRILDEACLALTEGQFLDLLFETEPQVSLDDYLWMIRGKTAALLACACQIGAAVATPDAATVRALHDFGYNLGMAFQIEDDILGAWGDPSVTGKPAADDLLHRKKTLPVVLTWEEGFAPGAPAAWRDAATLIRDLYASPSFGAAYVEKVLQALEAFDAKARCESLSQEYTLQAMDALSHAPLATESAEALRTVASTLLGRSR